jgi:hypothetical protein
LGIIIQNATYEDKTEISLLQQKLQTIEKDIKDNNVSELASSSSFDHLSYLSSPA